MRTSVIIRSIYGVMLGDEFCGDVSADIVVRLLEFCALLDNCRKPNRAFLNCIIISKTLVPCKVINHIKLPML